MDKLIELFVKEPEREFHVREIARLLEKSPTTISKKLREFEREGLISSSKKLNHLIFRAKSATRVFRIRKLSYNLETIESSGLVDFLEDAFNHPETISLFGSFARGENIKRSDIDIFVVSPLKKEVDLARFNKKIGGEIQLFVISRKDIEKMKEKNKELLNSMINGIVLYGHLEVLR